MVVVLDAKYAVDVAVARMVVVVEVGRLVVDAVVLLDVVVVMIFPLTHPDANLVQVSDMIRLFTIPSQTPEFVPPKFLSDTETSDCSFPYISASDWSL